jgi:hypothetical protein
VGRRDAQGGCNFRDRSQNGHCWSIASEAPLKSGKSAWAQMGIKVEAERLPIPFDLWWHHPFALHLRGGLG